MTNNKATSDTYDVDFDLLGIYVENLLLSKISFPVSCTLIAICLIQWLPVPIVAVWLSSLLFFLFLSTYLCNKFKKSQPIPKEKRKAWYYRIGIPRFLYMLGWSSTAFWAWDSGQPETYFIIVAMLVSTIAMNASQSNAVFRFYLMEITPKITAIVITAALSGEKLFYIIGFMSVIATITFTKIAKGNNQIQRLILKQRHELIHANNDVERASRAKSAFLATMSHEVRTPLNGILGVVNLLNYTTLNKQQRDYVETIRYSGDTLLTMLNDILDFSKLEAGKLSIERIPCETSRLVDSVMDLMNSRAKEKSILLSSNINDSVPKFIFTDPMRVRQVLLNLISNGIKFTEEGGVMINITSSIKDIDSSDRMTLRFEVADTGLGIPEEAHGNLFNDFTQVDSTTSRKYGGTGLGLSICRQIVELLNGKIGFFSSVGHGSIFWFEIPVKIAKPEDMAINNEDENLPKIAPLTILLAEDNAINQKVAVGLLSRFGHTIDVVNNGLEAVKQVTKKSYDLVLMDVQMPEMDGIQATENIRKLGGSFASLPIIALTANSMENEQKLLVKAGITDQVMKPIRLSQLMRSIAKFLPEKVS